MARLIAVSDLSNYLFCPRKLFYRYVKHEREPPNEGAVKGRTLHQALQFLIESEKGFLDFREDISTDIETYKHFALFQLESAIEINAGSLMEFKITPKMCIEDLKPSVLFESERRFEEIRKFVESGEVDLIEPKLRPEFDVKSEKLGLKGRVDCMEMWKEKHVPIDFKSSSFGKEVVPLGDKLQVTAYVMLLEKMYSKVSVPHGVLRYTRQCLEEKIIPTEEIKSKVNETAQKIREMLESEDEPSSCNHSFCYVCRNFPKIR